MCRADAEADFFRLFGNSEGGKLGAFLCHIIERTLFKMPFVALAKPDGTCLIEHF